LFFTDRRQATSGSALVGALPAKNAYQLADSPEAQLL
jgi:hypothetical protein